MAVFKSRLAFPHYLANDVHVGPDVTAGKYLGVSAGSRIQRSRVGAYCCIGHRVSINPYQHPVNWLSTHGFQFHNFGFTNAEYRDLKKRAYESVVQRDISIGNDVWVCDNAVVMADVADGAIIGAGAVVTKRVPAYAVVVGSPAQVKYFRFSEDLIERLLAVRWWHMNLSDLDGLPFHDIDRCIDRLETIRRDGVGKGRTNKASLAIVR